MRLLELLFGKPLCSEEAQKEQITVWSGVPALGLDALASAAYGPEAALTVLLPVAALSPHYIIPLTACVIAVLLAVYFSYRQTIAAYPRGGGSYTVSKENLGPKFSLLAASALSLDYILNVAVAISAGVGALGSAAPALYQYRLELCLGILVVLMIVNLRGVRSAGVIFMAPTYLFVACLAVTICLGIVKTFMAHGHPVPVIPPPPSRPAMAAVSAWLLLRAFASGCTALTGIEAVSNAVPVFREPTVRRAQQTLGVIAFILMFLLVGVSVLSRCYGIHATPPGQSGYQSVLSQMVAAVAGRGAFYYVTIGAILMVLALSANTSFAGFPRVWRLLALDRYLPPRFAHRGGRLVYSAGIIVLTVLAGSLLIIFGGVTDRLIPLFAIGAFLAFATSQVGMVAHWRRVRGRRFRHSLVLNGIGAVTTIATLLIIAVSKFAEGAWISILAIPVMMFLFYKVHARHERVDKNLEAKGPLDLTGLSGPIVVVPIKRLDRVSRKALRFALTIAAEVQALQIQAEEMKTDDLASQWTEAVERPARDQAFPVPRLVVIQSRYRRFFSPLLQYVRKLVQENPKRYIAIVVPELVERRWLQFIQGHRVLCLKCLLFLKGYRRVMIISAPWYDVG